MTSTTSRRADKVASNAMLSRYHASIAYHVSKIMRENPPLRRGAQPAGYYDNNESNSSPAQPERGLPPSAQKTVEHKVVTHATPPADDARSRKPSLPPLSVVRSKLSKPPDPPTQRSRYERGHLDNIQEIQPERKPSPEPREPDYPEKTDYVTKWLANVDHSYVPCQSPAISTLYADPELPNKNDTAIHIVYKG